ncbi:MAG: hypothetical protein JKY65_01400 [Planctomycetes bacterium]|nr:hypothetical protein [Planctomycetota bacterium]
MLHGRTLASSLALLCVVLTPAIGQERPAEPDFTGSWSSTFGTLVLTRDGVLLRGTYGGGGVSTLVGTLEGRKLVFRYTEVGARGEGWFQLAANSRSFSGKWRPDGTDAWADWTGTRTPPAPLPTTFSGLFETRYGRIRLEQHGDAVSGLYRYSGNWGRIKGTVKKGRLSFEWREPTTRGKGEFKLGPKGVQLRGKWSVEGQPQKEWNGQRVRPRPGVRWLVVLEAYWEEQLEQSEYSFGAMLRAYFRRYPRVEVRHRRFGDKADFVRAGREIAFLAEPVVLVIASHGVNGQLVAGQERIKPDLVGRVLKDLPNLSLVHFSSCEIFVGDTLKSIRAELPKGRKVPFSGYAVSVDWSGSALLEQLYFDLVLGRGISPKRAARFVKSELSFANDTNAADSPLGALKFRFQE